MNKILLLILGLTLCGCHRNEIVQTKQDQTECFLPSITNNCYMVFSPMFNYKYRDTTGPIFHRGNTYQWTENGKTTIISDNDVKIETMR
jgi:hypothetical protein